MIESKGSKESLEIERSEAQWNKTVKTNQDKSFEAGDSMKSAKSVKSISKKGNIRTFYDSFRSKVHDRYGFGRKLMPFSICMGIFNIIMVFLFLACFISFAVLIFQDYIDGLSNPRTSMRAQTLNPKFPLFAVCNDSSVYDIVAVNVCLEEDEMCCSEFDFIENREISGNDCGITFTTFNVSSRHGTIESSCLQVQFPELYGFGIYNGIDLQNLVEFVIVGEKRHLNISKREGLLKALTLVLYDLVTFQDIISNNKTVNFDVLVISSQGFIYLEPNRFSYLSMALEINEFVDGSSYNTYRLTPTSAEFEKAEEGVDYFEAVVAYDSDLILTYTQSYASFATAFGSLAGWLGALSDGWGCLTIIFFVEKVYLVYNNLKR